MRREEINVSWHGVSKNEKVASHNKSLPLFTCFSYLGNIAETGQRIAAVNVHGA